MSGLFEGCSEPPFLVIDGQRVLALGETTAAAAPALLPKTGGYVQFCDEETMAPKAHGSTAAPVQKNLKWNVDRKTADRICCFNRHAAEYRGYFQAESRYLAEVSRDEPTIYYDSVTGKPLFVAPVGRSFDQFLAESQVHGWPSFRDEEVVWENMRVLKASGEAVSADGTHLGHNVRVPRRSSFLTLLPLLFSRSSDGYACGDEWMPLTRVLWQIPDAKGNRYCINLVSVAGQPDGEAGGDGAADASLEEAPRKKGLFEGWGWL